MAMPIDTPTQAVSPKLEKALELASARHKHLCPRQVLGARCAIAAAAMLALEAPRKDKRLLVIVETDGCFVDGVEAAAGVSVGGRTLRVEDYGKIAATFVDVKTERALRVAPQNDVRDRARDYAPEQTRRYFAMLHGYQRMPDAELLSFEWVKLAKPVAAIVSRAGARAICSECGEEIINEREVVGDGVLLCRSCAGGGYYRVGGA
ncbi:MAG: FmdE family protein [Caldilineaceae bacterium]|nr:FmdE family protein [Caldilineaceae bacterium]